MKQKTRKNITELKDESQVLNINLKYNKSFSRQILVALHTQQL